VGGRAYNRRWAYFRGLTVPLIALLRNEKSALRYAKHFPKQNTAVTTGGALQHCQHLSSLHSPSPSHQEKQLLQPAVQLKSLSRSFLMRALTDIINRPNRERIREIGPDRACAEWLLRCGAYVKFQGMENFMKNYATGSVTPLDNPKLVSKLVEINAEEASITSTGFPHLRGVGLKKARFYNCNYFDDEALAKLSLVSETLEELEIGECESISERGLLTLSSLQSLKTLKIYGIPHIKNKESVLKNLKEQLPNCKIECPS